MEEFSIDSFALTDKVVLITGGASGLGRFYTQAVSKVGADVFIVSYDRTGWEDVRAEVEANGRRVAFLQQDITEPGAAKKIVDAAIAEYGRIDVLINNAGMQRRHDIVDFPDDDWRAVIELNLNALYYLSHEVAKVMIDRKGGKIVNIGSMQSYRAGKFIFPYTASKHGVMGLTRAYADALAPYNIQVNGLAPGYINTPMTKALQEDPVRSVEIREHIPAGHWGEPRELMGAMVFLCSSASNYITGAMIPVDGGYLLR
ncbi:2-deoxy-D-gluconate 3-dehydrogenase [Bifidobacterium primatium]|uniref:2-deoxy-D-gluconate 3-dehydrogenase n=2 Tax=Bifidobacterium TaxID=1678 RepID=A0A2M9HAC9_9BIFI|nr:MULTISPECIES: SDR family NAD(P)-dependent oxidoreductase [Bifidobacterium]NEG96537.1 SDR family oxidoreductase [Bifidobacterium sp. SMB2]NEH10546.1 SDR family oxidoreductase [Bifidobacterium saimiriisciurei]NEH10671.1 SDR family oxidoreductase [Bifidobacterium saimiriisciurei]PJM73773.1 2-deoxy-D-gluconate 3-dehydrogenase [Bifidobacterium primatium]